MLSRARRRSGALLAASACALLLLSGCAADDAPAEGDTAPETSGTHEVEHARGTTEVPDDPQRVVTLEPLELDTAVAVGIEPVGAAVASNVTGAPAYLEADGVEPVGTVPEPDLEAIVALKPDLILGTEARHSELYEQLSAIAPTVFIETQADPWRDNAMLVGEALGREDEVSDLLTAVDERCEALAEEYDVDGQTVQLIRPRDETTLSLYGPVSFSGSLLECVGFTIPDQDWADGLQADISPENILSATADHVFVTVADVDDESAVPAAITQNADAFPSVTLVDTSYWVSGVGPASAWAAAAQPGDHLVVNGPDARMGWTGYGLHWQPGDARRFLLVGDETAFPAVRGILATLESDADCDVIVECADPADDLVSDEVPAGVRVQRVLRESGDPRVESAVRVWGAARGEQARGDAGFYAWIAGESGTTTAIRRYLTAELGIPKERVSFLGYWRSGGPLVG